MKDTEGLNDIDREAIREGKAILKLRSLRPKWKHVTTRKNNQSKDIASNKFASLFISDENRTRTPKRTSKKDKGRRC